MILVGTVASVTGRSGRYVVTIDCHILAVLIACDELIAKGFLKGETIQIDMTRMPAPAKPGRRKGK